MQPSHVTFVGMGGHRKLRVWQDARLLVLEIYAVTRTLPRDERFVTVPQLRRAAWSVTNNIEGGDGAGRAVSITRRVTGSSGNSGESADNQGLRRLTIRVRTPTRAGGASSRASSTPT